MSGFSGASSRVPYLPVQIVHYRDQNAVVDKSGWPNRGSLGVAPIAEKMKEIMWWRYVSRKENKSSRIVNRLKEVKGCKEKLIDKEITVTLHL